SRRRCQDLPSRAADLAPLTERVKPVPQEHIDAALPHMPPLIRAMVQLQLLSGCRPAEVCLIRPIDIDMHQPSCWVYRPGSDQGPCGTHKTAHHGHERQIFLGPRAQAILCAHLGVKLGGYCFSPKESEATRNATKKASRKSPMTPSQRARGPKA